MTNQARPKCRTYDLSIGRIAAMLGGAITKNESGELCVEFPGVSGETFRVLSYERMHLDELNGCLYPVIEFVVQRCPYGEWIDTRKDYIDRAFLEMNGAESVMYWIRDSFATHGIQPKTPGPIELQ